LGLELARINNIDYYKRSYADFKAPEHLPNAEAHKRARRLLRNRLLRGMVSRYMNRLSYSRA
jgi:hypothetical protein